MNSYDNVLLVTGGAGFIGSAFLRMFVPKFPRWFFINLDVLTYAGDLKNVESIKDHKNYLFIHGDICDRELIKSLFDQYSINIVVNFAAESHVDNSIINPSAFLETNIFGTYCLLDVAKSFWTKRDSMEVSKFIQISTDEVYGSLKNDDPSSKEIDNLLPNSPYSASKASAELICRSYFVTFGVPVIVTRSSNNYGPYQNSEKLIPKIILNAIEDKIIPIYGDGNNVRDWIYVEDNCNAIMKIIDQGRIGEIYNIGGENELTNNAIVQLILDKLSKSLTLKEYVKDRLGHDVRYSLENNKLKLLGWTCETSFHLGINRTIDYYKKLFKEEETNV